MICEACQAIGGDCSILQPPESPEVYMDRPVPYLERWRPVPKLKLGLSGLHIDFVHRPYRDRMADHQEDYDRLIVSVFHNGIVAPVITYRDHVLVGMRRVEIAKCMQIPEVRCWEVQEDVTRWWKYDEERLKRLAAKAGEVPY